MTEAIKQLGELCDERKRVSEFLEARDVVSIAESLYNAKTSNSAFEQEMNAAKAKIRQAVVDYVSGLDIKIKQKARLVISEDNGV
jgi:hypothetical protein